MIGSDWMIAAWRCSARRSACSISQPLGIGAQIGVEQLLLLRGLALDLAGHREQVDEHRHLGAQHDRLDRLEHIVDRAHRIAAHQMLLLLVDRGEEDDRDALGLLAAADDLGGLVAVHAGHVDVEQDHRELALEQVAQRLLARARRPRPRRDPRSRCGWRADCARHRRRPGRGRARPRSAAGAGDAAASGLAPAAAGVARSPGHRAHSAAVQSTRRGGSRRAAAALPIQTRSRASSNSMSTGLAI